MDFPVDDDLFFAAALELEQKSASKAGNSVSVTAVQGPVTAASLTSARPQITPRADFFAPRHAKRPLVLLEEKGQEDQQRPEAKAPRKEAHWVWPESTDFPRRDYQYQMVVSCLRANTLVCLPTGLGKTFVAAVVMYNFYSWHPNDKVGHFLFFLFLFFTFWGKDYFSCANQATRCSTSRSVL